MVAADLRCGLTRHHDFRIGFWVGFRALGLSCGGFLRPFVASIISVVAPVRGACLGCRAPKV